MEQRNEPTTGEIVRSLRCDGDANNCVDCRYATYDTATILCDQEQNVRDAADRLESQERTIAELHEQIAEKNDEIQMARDGIEDTIKILTARAEKAELARDILCGTIRDMEEPKTVGSSTFTIERRGLQPQEGEGKENG